mmetsp:Transcript_87924/g.249069  ORF Transcript_87924/g.249069 Transcript_87924/m.249069 type:complete len:160 (+) Transcript_87924:72-551(+)
MGPLQASCLLVFVAWPSTGMCIGFAATTIRAMLGGRSVPFTLDGETGGQSGENHSFATALSVLNMPLLSQGSRFSDSDPVVDETVGTVRNITRDLIDDATNHPAEDGSKCGGPHQPKCNLFTKYWTFNYSLNVGAAIVVWIVFFLAVLSFCCCCCIARR